MWIIKHYYIITLLLESKAHCCSHYNGRSSSYLLDWWTTGLIYFGWGLHTLMNYWFDIFWLSPAYSFAIDCLLMDNKSWLVPAALYSGWLVKRLAHNHSLYSWFRSACCSQAGRQTLNSRPCMTLSKLSPAGFIIVYTGAWHIVQYYGIDRWYRSGMGTFFLRGPHNFFTGLRAANFFEFKPHAACGPFTHPWYRLMNSV